MIANEFDEGADKDSLLEKIHFTHFIVAEYRIDQ